MNLSEENKPLVSVVMITYKHEAFIAEAIEGVLMQEVDFPVELIIADDCSPDGTKEIAQRYIETHPKGHWIKYTRHSQNKGMMPNFIWALEQAKGEYIALCEGDDYWTDPFKIQKQVDLMIKEEATLCHTGALNSMGQLISKSDDEPDTIKRLSKGNFIITASVMIRKDILTKHTWVNGKYPFGDWPLWLTASSNGKILFLQDITTVYRINETGVWQNNWKDRVGSDRIIAEIKLLEEFKSTFPKFEHEVDEGILFRLRRLVDYYLESGSFGLILRNPLKSLIKKYPEFKKVQRRSRILYITTKLGL